MKTLQFFLALLFLALAFSACKKPKASTVEPVAATVDYRQLLLDAAPSEAQFMEYVQRLHGIRNATQQLDSRIAALPIEGLRVQRLMLEAVTGDDLGKLVYAYDYADPMTSHSGIITLSYVYYTWPQAGWILKETFIAPTPAGHTTVRGTVQDAVSGKGLPNAAVRIYTGAFGSVTARTDEAGRFVVAAAKDGAAVVSVAHPQYDAFSADVLIDGSQPLLGAFMLARPVGFTSGTSLMGTLHFRAACEFGADRPVAPAIVQGRPLGPWLSISTADGKSVADAIAPGADGRFHFRNLADGTYTLQVRAQALSSFWVGGQAVSKIEVLIAAGGEEGAEKQLGRVCLNNNAPHIGAIEASWGVDRMQAGAQQVLHLEEGAQAVALAAHAHDDDADDLTFSWGAEGGGFTGWGITDVTAQWGWPPPTTLTWLRVDVTDGLGGHAVLEVPVKLHLHRIEAQIHGGWLDFADPATLAAIQIEEPLVSSPDHGWFLEAEGLRAYIASAAEFQVVTAEDVGSYDAYEPISLATTFAVNAVAGNVLAGIMLGADDASQDIRFYIERFETHEGQWNFRIGDQVVAYGAMPAMIQGDQVTLRLDYTAASGVIEGQVELNGVSMHVGVFTQERATTGVRPSLAVRTRPGLGGTTSMADIRFTGMHVSRTTHLHAFPALGSQSTAGLLWTGNREREDMQLVDLRKRPKLSLAGILAPEGALAVLTDADASALLEYLGADSITEWQGEAAVPLSSGKAYLY